MLGFGGNDDKAYMTGLPEGVSIDAFGGSAWRREYARRVGGLMDVINEPGGFVVWIGLPQTSSTEQTRRFDVVNAVVQQEARKREGRAAFIDTYTMFAGDDGGYTRVPRRRLRAAAQGARRRRRPLRARGRRHDRPRGAQALNRAYDLTSWRKKSRA